MSDQYTYSKSEITLLDYFAAKAMQALFEADGFVFAAYERRAKEAYEMAQAMLKERERLSNESK